MAATDLARLDTVALRPEPQGVSVRAANGTDGHKFRHAGNISLRLWKRGRSMPFMVKSHGSWAQFAIYVVLNLSGQKIWADTFAWKNPPVSGAFNAPSSWQNADGNGGFPGAGDFAIFRDGTYTVTCDGAAAGMTEVIGTVTFQLNGNYTAGSYIQGGHPVVLQGGGTLQIGPVSSLGDGAILVDGSGLTMDSFDFRYK